MTKNNWYLKSNLGLFLSFFLSFFLPVSAHDSSETSVSKAIFLTLESVLLACPFGILRDAAVDWGRTSWDF